MRVMYAFALACALAGSMACAAREPAGPAWPKAAARDDDGGESLAPRAAARAVAAIAGDDRPADHAAGAASATAAAGDKPAAVAAGDKPASTNPAQQPTEDQQLDELIIEVDE